MPRGCCVTGWLAATSCRSAAKPFPTLPASPFPKRHDCIFMIASTRGSATLLPKNPTPELSRPSRLGSRAAVAPLKKADRKEQCDMKKQTLTRESLVGWQRILTNAQNTWQMHRKRISYYVVTIKTRQFAKKVTCMKSSLHAAPSTRSKKLVLRRRKR